MITPKIKSTTQVVPMIYAYTTPEVVRHNGWTKIGYTEQDVITRIEQQTHTADIEYNLEWQGRAVFDDGTEERFTDKDFFNSHRTGTLTINEKQYKLDIFAFMETDANVKPLFDPTNYTNQLEIIQQNNLYYNEPINKDILVALSTCKEPGSTRRTILVCSLIKD